MSRDYEYLLGDSSTERNRLDAQASLWDPVSHALFDRLHVAPGWRVLEIGPGTGSLNIELRRRAQRPVDVVEQSPSFCRSIRERWIGDGLGEGRIWESTLSEASLPAEHYDLIFARWVFLFLPSPEVHVRALVRALKPGGVLAVQDYFRDTFTLVPRPPDWEGLLAADDRFFATEGGDASIGTRLPLMFEEAGLEVGEIVPHVKHGGPGSAVWQWLTTYFLGVLDRYAEIGPLTSDGAARLATAWAAAGRRPGSLLIGPTVLDIVGRKR